MATFTLDNLKAEVEKKYAPTVVENGDTTYVLPNILQLPKGKRKAAFKIIDAFDEADDPTIDEQVDHFTKLVGLVVEDNKGSELLELLGDSPAVLLELVNTWMEGTQLGEA